MNVLIDDNVTVTKTIKKKYEVVITATDTSE